MKRASSLSKEEATKIKGFLTHTLAEFFYYPKVELNSEDDLSGDSDSDQMETSQDNKDSAVTDMETTAPSNGGGGGATPCDFPHNYKELEHHTILTNNTIYAFFRLFQFLCERLDKVYNQSLATIKDQMNNNNNTLTLQDSIAVKLGLKKLPGIVVDEYYPTFLNMAKSFMEGSVDSSSYEDTCREMFGVHAYLTFTIDRLVQNIVRQLHAIIADDVCLQVFEEHAKFVGELCDGMSPSSFVMVEGSYQKKMEGLLGDENCFKIVMTNRRQLKIELLESDECSDDNGTDLKV
jgi:paired amphipathic helix protein Sin3a